MSSQIQTQYIYLHGFASSPQSKKAQYLRTCFQEANYSLNLLDLNQGDFTHLTLTRQLRQVAAEFDGNLPVTLIGSSFGGLTAAWLGQKYTQVQRLVLLAPAFGFLDHWLTRLGEEDVQRWRDSGFFSVYHYSESSFLPLHYQFVTDARHYQDEELQRPLPTLILHGLHDDVIPIQASRDYAADRPWVQLLELDSDHALTDMMSPIWQAIQGFCL